jgi:hypothetical protein
MISGHEIDLKNIYDFSVEENTVLQAWYVLNAIKHLENSVKSTIKLENIKRDFYWVYTWKKKIADLDMYAIEQHLKDVCKHHQDSYGFPYSQQWLLDYGNTIYDRLIKQHFPYLAKKEEVATTITAISNI